MDYPLLTILTIIIFCGDCNYGSVSNRYTADAGNTICSHICYQDSTCYRIRASMYARMSPGNNIFHKGLLLQQGPAMALKSMRRWPGYGDNNPFDTHGLNRN